MELCIKAVLAPFHINTYSEQLLIWKSPFSIILKILLFFVQIGAILNNKFIFFLAKICHLQRFLNLSLDHVSCLKYLDPISSAILTTSPILSLKSKSPKDKSGENL